MVAAPSVRSERGVQVVRRAIFAARRRGERAVRARSRFARRPRPPVGRRSCRSCACTAGSVGRVRTRLAAARTRRGGASRRSIASPMRARGEARSAPRERVPARRRGPRGAHGGRRAPASAPPPARRATPRRPGPIVVGASRVRRLARRDRARVHHPPRGRRGDVRVGVQALHRRASARVAVSTGSDVAASGARRPRAKAAAASARAPPTARPRAPVGAASGRDCRVEGRRGDSERGVVARGGIAVTESWLAGPARAAPERGAAAFGRRRAPRRRATPAVAAISRRRQLEAPPAVARARARQSRSRPSPRRLWPPHRAAAGARTRAPEPRWRSRCDAGAALAARRAMRGSRRARVRACERALHLEGRRRRRVRAARHGGRAARRIRFSPRERTLGGFSSAPDAPRPHSNASAPRSSSPMARAASPSSRSSTPRGGAARPGVGGAPSTAAYFAPAAWRLGRRRRAPLRAPRRRPRGRAWPPPPPRAGSARPSAAATRARRPRTARARVSGRADRPGAPASSGHGGDAAASGARLHPGQRRVVHAVAGLKVPGGDAPAERAVGRRALERRLASSRSRHRCAARDRAPRRFRFRRGRCAAARARARSLRPAARRTRAPWTPRARRSAAGARVRQPRCHRRRRARLRRRARARAAPSRRRALQVATALVRLQRRHAAPPRRSCRCARRRGWGRCAPSSRDVVPSRRRVRTRRDGPYPRVSMCPAVFADEALRRRVDARGEFGVDTLAPSRGGGVARARSAARSRSVAARSRAARTVGATSSAAHSTSTPRVAASAARAATVADRGVRRLRTLAEARARAVPVGESPISSRRDARRARRAARSRTRRARAADIPPISSASAHVRTSLFAKRRSFARRIRRSAPRAPLLSLALLLLFASARVRGRLRRRLRAALRVDHERHGLPEREDHGIVPNGRRGARRAGCARFGAGARGAHGGGGLGLPRGNARAERRERDDELACWRCASRAGTGSTPRSRSRSRCDVCVCFFFRVKTGYERQRE